MASTSKQRQIKIGIDTGFGHTKYAYMHESEIIFGKFPSVVAFANDSISEVSDGVNVFEGHMYYVGNLANKQPSHTIEELISYKALEKYAPLLIAHVLKQEGIKPSEVSEIVCGLSPAHIDSTHAFKERVSSFEVNREKHDFSVRLLPQGVGAVTAIKHLSGSKKGLQEPNDYLVVDIGFNTVDVIFVYDKAIQRGKISEANSFEKRGAINIAEMMRKHISAEFGRDISLKEALPIVTQNSYRLRGEDYDLTEVVADFKRAYTKDIMEFLESKYGNEFDKMEKICFVGGGGYFIDTKYAKHIQVFEQSEYYNAIGNLVF